MPNEFTTNLTNAEFQEWFTTYVEGVRAMGQLVNAERLEVLNEAYLASGVVKKVTIGYTMTLLQVLRNAEILLTILGESWIPKEGGEPVIPKEYRTAFEAFANSLIDKTEYENLVTEELLAQRGIHEVNAKGKA